LIETAFIISTGDELTTGRTIDTNATFLADHLNQVGIDLVGTLVVGDDRERLGWAWRTALGRADLVLSTGGLGPTSDDLTTETIAAVTGRPLRADEPTAARIRQMFEAMGRTMPENNLKQALFPEGAEILPNRLGTAPGYRLDVAGERRNGHLVVLPGVPREMKPMFTEQVLPWIAASRGGVEQYLSRTFQTFGLSESALDELVSDVLEGDEAKLAFRAAFPQIAVRVTVRGEPRRAAERLEALALRIRERLGEYCYAEGERSMEETVGALLRSSGHTIAVAESCTGGLIANRLTDVAGSSAYVRAGVVAYSDDAKRTLLRVRPETLQAHGAVSSETAAEMAQGIRQVAGADLGLATTGIAGPGGGTQDKPVGTVCVALAASGRLFTHRYQLWGNRSWVKLLTSQIALDWVRRVELGKDPKATEILRK
jgi:nicotinamide-nucleotide amidase